MEIFFLGHKRKKWNATSATRHIRVFISKTRLPQSSLRDSVVNPGFLCVFVCICWYSSTWLERAPADKAAGKRSYRNSINRMKYRIVMYWCMSFLVYIFIPMMWETKIWDFWNGNLSAEILEMLYLIRAWLCFTPFYSFLMLIMFIWS